MSISVGDRELSTDNLGLLVGALGGLVVLFVAIVAIQVMDPNLQFDLGIASFLWAAVGWLLGVLLVLGFPIAFAAGAIAILGWIGQPEPEPEPEGESE